MLKIVVNDTNIFIDLLKIGLLNHFFQLSWEIHTTDFVLFELLREGQQETIAAYRTDNKLHVASFEVNEMCEIRKLHKANENKTNVSLTDCSVWYYAKREGYALLTGDRKLRTSSQKDGVEVHGIIYIFDAFIEEGILSAETAAEKLQELYKINPRLPKDEIERRIRLWKEYGNVPRNIPY